MKTDYTYEQLKEFAERTGRVRGTQLSNNYFWFRACGHDWRATVDIPSGLIADAVLLKDDLMRELREKYRGVYTVLVDGNWLCCMGEDCCHYAPSELAAIVAVWEQECKTKPTIPPYRQQVIDALKECRNVAVSYAHYDTAKQLKHMEEELESKVKP